MEQMEIEMLAALLLKVIDENHEAQDSNESEEWKLGYHEACDMVLNFLSEYKKKSNGNNLLR
jgi:hypothetical protein